MNKIEEVRREKGLTRNELSKRSGVSNKMLWEYEKRKKGSESGDAAKDCPGAGCDDPGSCVVNQGDNHGKK